MKCTHQEIKIVSIIAGDDTLREAAKKRLEPTDHSVVTPED